MVHVTELYHLPCPQTAHLLRCTCTTAYKVGGAFPLWLICTASSSTSAQMAGAVFPSAADLRSYPSVARLCSFPTTADLRCVSRKAAHKAGCCLPLCTSSVQTAVQEAAPPVLLWLTCYLLCSLQWGCLWPSVFWPGRYDRRCHPAERLRHEPLWLTSYCLCSLSWGRPCPLTFWQ